MDDDLDDLGVPLWLRTPLLLKASTSAFNMAAVHSAAIALFGDLYWQRVDLVIQAQAVKLDVFQALGWCFTPLQIILYNYVSTCINQVYQYTHIYISNIPISTILGGINVQPPWKLKAFAKAPTSRLSLHLRSHHQQALLIAALVGRRQHLGPSCLDRSWASREEAKQQTSTPKREL